MFLGASTVQSQHIALYHDKGQMTVKQKSLKRLMKEKLLKRLLLEAG